MAKAQTGQPQAGQSRSGRPQGKTFLEEAIQTSRRVFWYVFLFSLAVNLLMLVVPLYSLQVMDRVISSQSMETLAMLSLVVVGSLIVLGIFTGLRSLVLVQLGEWFDRKISSRLLMNSLSATAVMPGSSGSQSLRDFATLKAFLTGAALSTLFDVPWAFIYILVLYAIHPVPGTIALVGGIILFIAALFNEKAVKSALGEANEQQIRSLNMVETSARNSEVIEAMGMMDAIVTNWQEQNKLVVAAQSLASNRSAVISAVVKVIRMLLQIAVTGSGAYLAIHNEMTFGGIIAGGIIVARALAPFEQSIAAWSSIAGARKAYDRLQQKIHMLPERPGTIDLPAPEGRLSVEKLVYAPPGSQVAVLKGVQFALNPGEALGIIGPSAAGKSTLAKLMVGVYKANSGEVRLDSADVYTWKRDQFGKFVGYLPQDVELFDGTVRENLARMQKNAPDEEVIAAAQVSGAHDMILRLAQGYDTPIGIGGSKLSAGQRQRIGLARAFYGKPKFMVLDEPNSNLDEAGENALVAALKNAKALGITTVIISHRPAVLGFVDKIMVLRDGTVAEFGKAQEVLAKLRGAAQGAAAQPSQPAQPPKIAQIGQPGGA